MNYYKARRACSRKNFLNVSFNPFITLFGYSINVRAILIYACVYINVIFLFLSNPKSSYAA